MRKQRRRTNAQLETAVEYFTIVIVVLFVILNALIQYF